MLRLTLSLRNFTFCDSGSHTSGLFFVHCLRQRNFHSFVSPCMVLYRMICQGNWTTADRKEHARCSNEDDNACIMNTKLWNILVYTYFDDNSDPYVC